MGSCLQKLKNAQKEQIKQKQQMKTINAHHSKTQSMQTQETELERIKLEKKKEKKKEKLINQESTQSVHHIILTQTCKLSKIYSLLNSNIKDQTSVNQQIVQNNLTGRVRLVETLRTADPHTQIQIQNLTKNPISHPNIVQVHEIFYDEDQTHLIYDYCSGGKLSSLITKQGQGIDENTAMKFLVQMMEATNYIHSKQCSHGHFTINSFSKIDESESNFIKLTEIKPIYSKSQITQEQWMYISPEIVDNEKEYSIARDVWAIGIIFYKLLTGIFPYPNNQIHKLKSDIKKGIIQFQELQFDKISTRSKDILSKLLQFNPSFRSDLSSILKSQMYRKISQQTKQISQQALGVLTNVKPANLLQTMFLQFMVNQFCQNQQQEIYQLFNKYDQNGDAKLSKVEIFDLLLQQLKSSQEAQKHVQKIFQAVDIDKNGTIDCDEFLRCIIDRAALITTANLKIVFKIITNGKGSIHKKRFMQCFQVSEEQTNKLFALATKTKRITFKVFSRIMLELV